MVLLRCLPPTKVSSGDAERTPNPLVRLAFLAGESGVEPRRLPFREERGESSSSLSSERLEPRLNRPPPREESSVSLLPLSAVPPRVERPPKSPRAMPSGDLGEDLPESGVSLRLLLRRLFEFPRPLAGLLEGEGLLVPPNLFLEFLLVDCGDELLLPPNLLLELPRVLPPPPLLEARLPSLSSSSDSSTRLGARPFPLNRLPFCIEAPVAPLAAAPPPLLSLAPAESAEPDRVRDPDLDLPTRLLGESELESLAGEERRPRCRCLARHLRLGGDGVLDFCVLILGSALLLLEGPRSKVGILSGRRLGGARVRSGPSPQELLSSLSTLGMGCCACAWCLSCSLISRILRASMSDRSMSEIRLRFSFLPLDLDRFLLLSLSSSLILSSIRFGLRNDVPMTYCRSFAS